MSSIGSHVGGKVVVVVDVDVVDDVEVDVDVDVEVEVEVDDEVEVDEVVVLGGSVVDVVEGTLGCSRAHDSRRSPAPSGRPTAARCRAPRPSSTRRAD